MAILTRNIYQSLWVRLASAAAPASARLVLGVMLSSDDVSDAGVIAYTPQRWATLTGLEPDEVVAALDLLEQHGFIVADAETDEVWLRDFVRFNSWRSTKPTNDQIRSVMSARIRQAAVGRSA